MQEIFENLKNTIGGLRLKYDTLFLDLITSELISFSIHFINSDEQQKIAIGGLVTCVIALSYQWCGCIFSGIDKLENRLSSALSAVNKLKITISEKKSIDKLFKKTESDVLRVANLRHNSYYEALAKEHNVDLKIRKTIVDKSDKKISVSSGGNSRSKFDLVEVADPLFKKVNFITTDFNIRKVSLPKLTRILVAIDKDGAAKGANVTKKYLRITNLKIEKNGEDRLYFDASFKVRAYARKQ